MVFDEIYVKDGTQLLPIDSIENQPIEEIIYEGQVCHFAKQKDVTGTSDVVADNGVEEPIRSLSVSGATLQSGTPTPETPIPIQNANDNGMSVILRGENLFNAQGDISNISNRVNFSFGNNFIKKTNVNPSASDRLMFAKKYPAGTYTLSFKTVYSKTGGYTIRFLSNKRFEGGTYNSYYGAYYKDVSTQENPDASLTVTLVEDATIGFAIAVNTAYGTMNITDIMLTPTSQAVEYKPYVEETIEIPTSIDVNGTNVPLLFSEYDKLTVDRLNNNKAVYSQGSYKRTYTGNESLYASTFSENNGYGRWYCDSANLPITSTALCTHFKRTSWIPDLSVKNVFVPAEVNSTTKRIFFKTDGSMNDTFANDMTKFKEWLKTQHDAGTPVTVIAKRITPIEHDITDTDLGQSLLALATGKGTNYLEITSSLPVSQTDLSYWEQIVPETT